MVEARPTETGSTVTLKGMEIFRAAGILSDQVQDVLNDLSSEAEAGLRSATITMAIERLSDLEGWLETLGYGAAGGAVEIPLSVLYPLSGHASSPAADPPPTSRPRLPERCRRRGSRRRDRDADRPQGAFVHERPRRRERLRR
jgi:hypothetical protein